ncbi:MAG: hypothetical protein JL56_14270 [Desulfotomaculum sp. BICA1-6]|nr:MAG: hypothetical protein JL56_14270 [Desulfotomaculum sp. BICA1-6]
MLLCLIVLKIETIFFKRKFYVIINLSQIDGRYLKMHDNNENTPIKEFEAGINATKNKKSPWKMVAICASMIAVVSLSGIWYVNNERAFLHIENIKLEVEAENLREEIHILQTAIVENNNSVKDNNSEPNDTQTENTQTETTQTESSQTEDDYVNYEVKPGDTLTGISVSLYGTENYVSQIAELNGLNAESILQLGQKIKTPKDPNE